MERTLIIDIKALSWNALARKNHWIFTKIANEFKLATVIALRKAKFEPICHDEYPLAISFHSRWKQRRRHDIDSCYAKAVIDQLTLSKIIVDDSLEYIKQVTFTGETGAERDEIILTFRSQFQISF